MILHNDSCVRSKCQIELKLCTSTSLVSCELWLADDKKFSLKHFTAKLLTPILHCYSSFWNLWFEIIAATPVCNGWKCVLWIYWIVLCRAENQLDNGYQVWFINGGNVAETWLLLSVQKFVNRIQDLCSFIHSSVFFFIYVLCDKIQNSHKNASNNLSQLMLCAAHHFTMEFDFSSMLF